MASNRSNFELTNGADFQTDGTFTLNSVQPFRVANGSTFSVGDLSGGSVSVTDTIVNGGSQVTIPDLTTGGTFVDGAGSSLHVAGDFLGTSKERAIEILGDATRLQRESKRESRARDD
jgi:hypothetical protein